MHRTHQTFKSCVLLLRCSRARPLQRDVRALCWTWGVRRRDSAGKDRPLWNLIAELQEAVYAKDTKLAPETVAHVEALAEQWFAPAVTSSVEKPASIAAASDK